MKRLIALTLAAALSGCASTTLNGDPVPASPTGQDVARAIAGIVLVGALIWAASEASQDDGPDETWTTSCRGSTCTTSVYR